MRSVLTTLVLAMAFLACSCSHLPPQAVEYFGTNQANFIDAGATCLINSGDEYGISGGYAYQESEHSILVNVHCGESIYSISCDPTKKYDEHPCSDVLKFVLNK